MNIKKIFKKSCALIVSAVMIFSMFSVLTVSAATTATVAYTEGEPASITVTINTNKPERAAVVSVYSLYDENKYWILSEATRTTESNFTFTNTLPLTMPSGVYTVNVSIGGDTTSDTFTHFSIAGANSAMERVNDATVLTFISEIRDPDVYINLAIDVEEFNTYANLITPLFFAYKPLNPDSTPKDLSISEFSTLYNKCLALVKLKGASEDTIAEYLLNNSDKIDFDYAKFDELKDSDNPEELTDAQKEIIKRFADGIYTEASTQTQYDHWLCLASINAKTVDTTTVYETAILDTYAPLLQLSRTDYDNVIDKGAVIRAVMGNKYDTIDALKAAFYSAVAGAPVDEEEEEEEEEIRPSGSSGGRTPGVSVGLVDLSNKGNTNKTEEKNDNKTLFTDVPQTHWCFAHIKALHELSVITGDGNGSFRPDAAVSRAEFTKMLMNALFTGQTASNPAGFTDVSDAKWYASYVNLAAELGIILGDESGRFNPDMAITRQDMAVMLKRALLKAGLAVSDGDKTFADDASISAYAKSAVSALTNAGILNGMDNGNFEPQGELLRAQAAKALYEIMKTSGKF